MKNNIRWAVLSALCLVFVSFPAAAFGAAWITLDHWSGNPGDISVWGGGFGPNDSVSIMAGSSVSTVATTDAFGDLASTTIALPQNTPQGSVAITGTGSPSGLSASNSFYVVQYTPSVSVSGDNHAPGATLSVSGSGFAPGETVRFAFGSATTTGAVVADSGGAFTNASLAIPFIPAGTYTLTGVGGSSGASSGPVYFYVNGLYPSVSPSAYYALPGGVLNFSGSGFAGNEAITVTAEGVSSTLASFSADPNGSFANAGGVTIPLSSQGEVMTFHAHGGTSGADASVMVAVGRLYPTLTPSTYWLMPGATLSFSGAGFAAGEQVSIYDSVATTTAVNATAGANGGFASSSLAIPFSMSGSARTFIGHGVLSGASASVSVTIGGLFPSIQPSSYYVLQGYPFTVSGTGFAPNEDISFSIGGSSSTIHTTANTSGNFFLAGPFNAPAASFGTVTVNAHGGTSGVDAPIDITVGKLYPTVTPTDYWLSPLENLTFRGSGFVPEENVSVTLGTSTIATVPVNAFGNFVDTATAPSRAGTAAYTFTGSLSGAQTSLTLTVAGLYPSVSAESYYVAPGDQVFVQGSGFLNNEQVRIDVASTSLTATANGVGTVAPTVITMPVATGSVSVRMTGLLSGASAFTSISLIPFAPQVTPSLWYAAPGTPISFSGTGFAPVESVAVSSNGSSTTSVSASATGTIMFSGILPYGSAKAHYAFTGAISGATATADITIASLNPWMYLDTYYAAPGMPLLVSGRGFGANEGISIAADNTVFATTTANASGGFDLHARVPVLPAGNKTVHATGDLSGAMGTTGITVAQQYLDFELQNYAPAPGDAIHFFGGGYVPGETLSLTTDRTGNDTVHMISVDASGRFDDASYLLPASSTPGNLTFTATGNYSGTPKTVTIYVTGG